MNQNVQPVTVTKMQVAKVRGELKTISIVGLKLIHYTTRRMPLE